MASNLKGLDANQVLRSVYDDTKNTLRVSIIDGSTGGGSFEVIINHMDDSVRLGNGTDYLTSTYIGPKIGLDVNVINTGPVPTGGATEAKQDVGNASLASIDSKLTSPIAVTGPLTNAQLRATPVPVSGTMTVVQPTGTNLHTVVDNPVKTIQLLTLPFDTVTATYPSPTQEVYQSRVGGLGGTVQETVTINYVDATKNLLLNVVRT